MEKPITITQIDFDNYKAFERFTVHLQHLNILVGPNNSGKSTVLSAFQVLAAGLRRARAKNPVTVDAPGGRRPGYVLTEDNLPISMENVHTDYADTDTKILFRLSNSNELMLLFPKEGDCILIPYSRVRTVGSPKIFKEEFPITVGMVPVLGPVEHREQLLEEETVRKGLSTHRASRHFRNYWSLNPTGFHNFANLLRTTWPGMDIDPPHLPNPLNKELAMFCREDRITRELYWCGFGFQIWCQILTHISRNSESTIIVIDEPEIYLHPDVQRQLVGILRDAGPSVVTATHSSEIMGEADPSEILLIDKAQNRARRLKDVAQVQSALESIGSIQNLTLARLARNNCVLFVEDEDDFKLLCRFARLLGYHELAAGLGITPIKSGGFSFWERVRNFVWGMRKLGGTVKIGAIFDSDYWSKEEIATIREELKEYLDFAHVWDSKEIENYLLVPGVLQRALNKALDDTQDTETELHSDMIKQGLNQITDALREDTLSQYIAKRNVYLRTSGRDASTINREAISVFNKEWKTLETRMTVVPGKEVLKALRQMVQSRVHVTLSDARIMAAFRKTDVPSEITETIAAIDTFRRSAKHTAKS